MTSERSLERRTARLENETESLYEIVDGIRRHLKRHDKRFTGLENRFGGVENRLTGVEDSLAEVLRRLPEPT